MAGYIGYLDYLNVPMERKYDIQLRHYQSRPLHFNGAYALYGIGFRFRGFEPFAHLPNFPFCLMHLTIYYAEARTDQNAVSRLTGPHLALIYRQNGKKSPEGYYTIYFDFPLPLAGTPSIVWQVPTARGGKQGVGVAWTDYKAADDQLKDQFNTSMNQTVFSIFPTELVEMVSDYVFDFSVLLSLDTKIDATMHTIQHTSPILGNYMKDKCTRGIIPRALKESVPYEDVEDHSIWSALWCFIDPEDPYCELRPARLKPEHETRFHHSFVNQKMVNYIQNPVISRKIGRKRTHIQIQEEDKLPDETEALVVRYELVEIKPRVSYNARHRNFSLEDYHGEWFLGPEPVSESESEEEIGV
jgi:hypothetical protein